MTDYLHALPSGYRIQEYELVRVLGSGGFGITYLGYDHNLDKAVAIKEYLPNDLAVRGDNHSALPKSTQDKADYEWGLDSFLSEAKTLARFDHRHLIKIYRFFRSHGTGYIVMEYAEGETLSETLKRKGTLTEVELKTILFPILDGLEAVHKADFLHRDVKPSNIIIRDDGSPVLIDFGSARQAVAGKSRSVTAIITPGYAPIEQYSVKGHQGPWTDIYSLGAVCYRCLTGEQPDDATERLREDPLAPAVRRCEGKASASLLDTIDRALRVDERERPQTIKAWRSELERSDDKASEGGVETGGMRYLMAAERVYNWHYYFVHKKGEDMPQDFAEAARRYRLDAEEGNPKAQFNLGHMYHVGYMFDRAKEVPQDYGEATHWYRLAAEQGYASAQINLGVMYIRGEGVSLDFVEAMRWFRLAAEQGKARAQFNLGNMYYDGKGVPQDYGEAERWYRLAAEKGQVDAQHALSWMYRRGKGVPQDHAEAARWSHLAVERDLAAHAVMHGKEEEISLQQLIKAIQVE